MGGLRVRVDTLVACCGKSWFEAADAFLLEIDGIDWFAVDGCALTVDVDVDCWLDVEDCVLLVDVYSWSGI